ncbi:Hypothetical protein ING2D1G_1165 [Peptoniphilus sp. ING2-D1G]|nr:Hypothetical protein ING2D1G_1165 [Peptoniphilus sp. ING2-D1G]
MKKLILMLVLTAMTLTACGQKNNENNMDNIEKTNNVANVENESINLNDKEKIDNQTDASFDEFTGSIDNFNAILKITPFTNADLEDVKNEFGENSDEYLCLQDDRPLYKLETYLNYTGDTVEGIQDVDEIKYTITIDGEDITSEFFGNRQVMESLLSKRNLSHGKYYYKDSERSQAPTDSSEILLKSEGNAIDVLNFEIKLNKAN